MSSYATTDDLALVMPAANLQRFTADQQQRALDDASALADGYLRSRFKLPLTAYSRELTTWVCKIAYYNLMSGVGFNPEGNQSIVMDWDKATSWLKQVSQGIVTPTVTDSSGAPAPAAPIVLSNCPRGW